MSSRTAAALAVIPFTPRAAASAAPARRSMVWQVSQLVADFEVWRKVFASYAGERKENGISGHRVFAVLGRPGALIIELDVADAAKASRYLQSPGFHAGMRRAGGLGKTEALVLTSDVESVAY